MHTARPQRHRSTVAARAPKGPSSPDRAITPGDARCGTTRKQPGPFVQQAYIQHSAHARLEWPYGPLLRQSSLRWPGAHQRYPKLRHEHRKPERKKRLRPRRYTCTLAPGAVHHAGQACALRQGVAECSEAPQRWDHAGPIAQQAQRFGAEISCALCRQ